MEGNPPGSSFHGVFQQEYWSGLPFSPPGDLPDPPMEPTCAVFPAWQMDSLPGKSNMRLYDPIKKKQQLRNFPRGPADKNPMQGLDQPNPWGV